MLFLHLTVSVSIFCFFYRCSDGFDRYRSEWLGADCNKSDITQVITALRSLFFWTSLFSIRELRFDGVRSFVLWECIWLNQFYFRYPFGLKTCPLHPASLSRADLQGWDCSLKDEFKECIDRLLLFYIGRKLCHSKGGAGARARVYLRPRSLAYSCHLCMCNSTDYSRGVAGLCIHSSQL